MLSPSDSALSLEPFGLAHPPHPRTSECRSGMAAHFVFHSPSHETGDHFVRLYPVKPGGAHAMVNWSFSI